MEIGINLHGYRPKKHISDEMHCALMKENGFTTTFCMSDSPFVKRENINMLEKYGIRFDMLHAPFSGINNMWRKGKKGDDMLKKLMRAVDTCASGGIQKLVVHLSSAPHTPFMTKTGFDRFDALMEHSLKKNIKILYENIRPVKNLSVMFERQPDALFCWDTGHEHCFSFGKKFMNLFASRLSGLHIHDNRCLPFCDDHRLPFDGKIDFDGVARELACSSYDGPLMLEVLAHKTHLYSTLTPEQYYKRAGDAIKKLRDTVLKYRQSKEG